MYTTHRIATEQEPLELSSSRKSIITVVLLMLISMSLPSSIFAEWKSAGTLSVPENAYSFLAATPTGDLLAATFNKGEVDSPERELPLLLIKNPDSVRPQVQVLTRDRFVGQRGYGGVACDSKGNIYVSGDTGNPATCFIKKFKPDGSPDVDFGQGGVIKPNRRTLGMDVLGNFLITAFDWGLIQVYDANTGLMTGSTTPLGNEVFVRDIAIDPKSMRVFGVAAGSVVTWGDGSPWYPTSYSYRRITNEAGRVRSGEGVSMDPIRRTVLITPIPGNVLLEIEGSGRVNKYRIQTANPAAHLADSVLSFDGETLYISDIKENRIHVMKRDVSHVIPAIVNSMSGSGDLLISAETTKKPEAVIQPVKWHRSYTDVVQQARQEQKPMVVYFRSKEIRLCQSFENNILLTDEFNRSARGYICVFEDASIDPLMAYRFGVYRVPHLFLLDQNGETFAEFNQDNTQPERLYHALLQLSSGIQTGG